MKPCAKKRELIAWLVLGHLEPERAIDLRKHLETCEGCRRSQSELGKLAATAQAIEPELDLEATASFHRRFVARVQAEQPGPFRWSFTEFLRTHVLRWRVALPVAVGFAVMLAMLWLSARAPFTHAPAASSASRNGAAQFDSNLQPTVANYQMVANQSLDNLDQLLNGQGKRNLPSVHDYTASTFPIASEVD